MNRQDILARMKSDKNKDLMVVADGDKFIAALESKVKILSQTLDQGLDINGIDTLLIELENLNNLRPAVRELHKAIKDLDIPELPESISIDGISTLLDAVRNINKAQVSVDLTPLNVVNKKLTELIKIVEQSKVPAQGQKPTDFIPMRRVVYVSGRTPMYDDSFYTGGGGGGGTSTPTILYQPIVQAGAGTTALVGAVVGKRIKVTNYVVVMGGAGTVKFQSNSADITGAMSFAANGGVATGGTEFSTVFQSGVNEGLSLITTGAAGNGHMSYYLE